MKAGWIAAAALVVAGCGGALGEDRELIEAARAEFETELADYPSARFRNVHVLGEGPMMCGQVNAKNALGAYIGWRAFSFYGRYEGSEARLFVKDDAAGALNCGSKADGWKPADLSNHMTYRS